MNRRTSISSEQGSIFTYILVAVALFAALSFAVTSMTRGGGGGDNISSETAKIYATEIMDYGRRIKDSIQEMQINNGCSDTEISFENNVLSGYDNGTNTSCQVFHTDGGGMNYEVPPDDWMDTNADVIAMAQYQDLLFMARTCVPGVGTGIGTCWSDSTDNEDLVMIIPFIKEDVCLAINEKMGIEGTPTDRGCAWAWSYRFTGTFTNALAINNSNSPTVTDEIFWGKTTGCYQAVTTGCNWLPDSYHFYQVLFAR